MIRVVDVIPQSQSGDSSNDGEPTIAVNPTDPRQIAIATTNTPFVTVGTAARGQVYVSNDAGQNWQSNPIIPTAGVGDITVDFAALVAAGWDLRSGDQFYTADLDNDGSDEVVVLSPDGRWLGVLRSDGVGGLTVAWIVHDWVNPPGVGGAHGWQLRSGDRVYPADVDGDGADELVIASPDSQWIGVLKWDSQAGVVARGIAHDWVNPPGGTGASGWDLRSGDHFYVADIDGDDADELIVVSPDGEWIGVLGDDGAGGLAADWIAHNWVNPPGGTGASGWQLRSGDHFEVIFARPAAAAADRLVVVSPGGQWIGILGDDGGGGLSAQWIAYDWVNSPGGSGASGWDLRSGDRFHMADIDGDGIGELVVVSADGQWIGILDPDGGGGLVAQWIAHDWVTPPGGTGSSGWDLRSGDRVFPADVDHDGVDELVVVSPDGEWIGILSSDGAAGLTARWIGRDWVNHPGGSGASGWNLRSGDHFYVADVDGDGADEVLVTSPDGQWIGFLASDGGGGLAAGWIARDWVNPPQSSAPMFAGILEPTGVLAPLTFDVLRARDFTAATVMETLESITGRSPGSGRDQPWIVGTVARGLGGELRTFVGFNDLDNGPRTASVEMFRRADDTRPTSSVARLERRSPPIQDSPAVRVAIHPDGHVYAAFMSWTTQGTATAGITPITSDVVVVRDDAGGVDANPFSRLSDPLDGVIGLRVATGIALRFNATLGADRIGTDLAIAVDPTDSATVYVTWCDDQGTGPTYTLHVQRSQDSGATWSGDLQTIANARNPALAVNAVGTVGLMFQQLVTATTPGAPNRWQTHFQRGRQQGQTWTDFVLADTPVLAWQGDYLQLKALGSTFFGAFCANNTPLLANFPQGVKFLRAVDTTMGTLSDGAGTSVAATMDPFFVKITEPPDEPSSRILCRRVDRYGVRSVGGVNPDGTRWELTVNDVISRIEDDQQAFFVEQPAGDRVDIEIATSSRGRRYIKTVADSDAPNNLLNLPSCP